MVGQIHNSLGPWIAAGSSTARHTYHPTASDKTPTFGSQHEGCAYFANGDGFAYFFDMARTDERILGFLARRDDFPDGQVKADDYFRYATASAWKKSKGTK